VGPAYIFTDVILETLVIREALVASFTTELVVFSLLWLGTDILIDMLTVS
jgi:hypothetical protein